jgi:hypothetical protein
MGRSEVKSVKRVLQKGSEIGDKENKRVSKKVDRGLGLIMNDEGTEEFNKLPVT